MKSDKALKRKIKTMSKMPVYYVQYFVIFHHGKRHFNEGIQQKAQSKKHKIQKINMVMLIRYITERYDVAYEECMDVSVYISKIIFLFKYSTLIWTTVRAVRDYTRIIVRASSSYSHTLRQTWHDIILYIIFQGSLIICKQCCQTCIFLVWNKLSIDDKIHTLILNFVEYRKRLDMLSLSCGTVGFMKTSQYKVLMQMIKLCHNAGVLKDFVVKSPF